jgi:hypothetical protein
MVDGGAAAAVLLDRDVAVTVAQVSFLGDAG